MDRPQLLAQAHPDRPDEIACLVSLVPTFTPPNPQEEMEVVENERPEEADSIKLPGEASDNVFIFIVDRSGSMGGQKMEMTKEALKLFIQSLPAGCKFEIISFGSNY
jgi:Mg-chelatase subunit ChlD